MNADPWPALPLDEWLPTYTTLHRWTQIVGKTRLGLAPFQNHWWHATLYVSARGLTTSAMPYVEFLGSTYETAASLGGWDVAPLRSSGGLIPGRPTIDGPSSVITIDR